MSGRTGALGIHVGDLVRANDATPLVVINQVSPIYVTFSVPGRYLGEIRRFQAQKPLAVQARGQAPIAPGAQAPAPPTPTPLGSRQDVAPGQGATMPGKPGTDRERPRDVHRQHRRSDDRDDQDEGRRSRTPTRASGPDCSSR